MNKKMKNLPMLIITLIALPLIGLAQAGLIDPNAAGDPTMKVTFPTGGLNATAETIANYVIGFLVLVAVFYIIKAGYEFITAGGDADTISKARQSIMYAAIGIIIALLSKGIATLILGAVK